MDEASTRVLSDATARIDAQNERQDRIDEEKDFLRGPAVPDESTIHAEIDAHDKCIAHLRARCALAGYTCLIVQSTTGNGSAFLISRWGHSVELADVALVEAFLRQIGAK